MAFKEFGVLFESLHVCQHGYYPTPGIVLIINENDIYQVPFLPGPQGPRHHKSNPHIKWREKDMFHDFLGQKIGEQTLLYHSVRPFRIEDLAHTILPLSSTKFWESTCSFTTKMGIQDDFIEEVKYRQAKNDRIEELEKQLIKKYELVNVLKEKVLKRDSQLEDIINQRDTFAKRLFEVTEELTSLKQVADTPVLVAEEIPDASDLKAQVQSLKLQLATEKRISQKYARDLQEKDKQQSVLTAM